MVHYVGRQMNKKNLLKLATFLDNLPRKKFEFERWFGDLAKEPKADLSCGTKACALGWAATIPAFKKLGAGIELEECWSGPWAARFTLDGRVCYFHDLAIRLFDIDENDAGLLFIQGPRLPRNRENPTPKDIAKHIRKFVAGNV